MGLKIGDVVLVKPTLEVGCRYGKPLDGMRCYFAEGMHDHKGKLATVIEITNEDRYKLKFDDGVSVYYFTEDMLIKNNYAHVKLIEGSPCFKLSVNSIDILFVKTDNGFVIQTEGDVLEYKEIDNRTMECLEEFIYNNIGGEFK